jgi:hypothetical protein
MADINRRGLFGGLLALFFGPRASQWSHVPVKTTQRPWARPAEELFEKEGPYADYSAWEEWIQDRLDDFYPGSCWATEESFDEMDAGSKIAWYYLMCKLADGVRQEVGNG